MKYESKLSYLAVLPNCLLGLESELTMILLSVPFQQLPTMRRIQILDVERLQSAEKLGMDTDRRFCGYFQKVSK